MRRSVARGFALVLMTACGVSCKSQQERVCAEMGAAHLKMAKAEWDRDYSNIATETFYSPAVDSCVHVEVAKIGVEFEVRDLSHTILRDGGNFTLLLHCDPDGADSVILDAVRSRRGMVYNTTYGEWLDDGFGGPPRALKTPDTPYSRSDCQRVLDKWLSILRK